MDNSGCSGSVDRQLGRKIRRGEGTEEALVPGAPVDAATRALGPLDQEVDRLRVMRQQPLQLAAEGNRRRENADSLLTVRQIQALDVPRP